MQGCATLSSSTSRNIGPSSNNRRRGECDPAAKSKMTNQQIPLPGMNPVFWKACHEQKDIVYASLTIIAEWFGSRSGQRSIKLYRPGDKANVLDIVSSKEKAIRMCLSLDDHAGDFSAAKRSGWMTGDEERAAQAERASESEAVRWIRY